MSTTGASNNFEGLWNRLVLLEGFVAAMSGVYVKQDKAAFFTGTDPDVQVMVTKPSFYGLFVGRGVFGSIGNQRPIRMFGCFAVGLSACAFSVLDVPKRQDHPSLAYVIQCTI
jgi:hypothetical protein